MQRMGFLAAWLLATIVATAGAWQVVGAAESEVFDAPLTPVIAISSTAPTAPRESVSTFDTPSTVADPLPGSTPTTVNGSGDDSTASTQVSTATGETGSVSHGAGELPLRQAAVDPPPAKRISVPTEAGTVTATGDARGVSLVAVLATPGWSYVVEDADQDDRVTVRFERGSAGIEIEIRWDGSRLVADVDRD